MTAADAMGEEQEPTSDAEVAPLRLTFQAMPEQVAVARHALAAFGRQAGLDETALADLTTIVTEACMNAIAHAYRGRGGRVEVSADSRGGEVSVVIRDHGGGIHPHPAAKPARGPLSASRRLGLLLIAALAERVEIRSRDGEGTELRATVAAGRT